MKEYAEKFYKSKAWQKCRASYIKSVGGLCEDCLAKGIYRAGAIVHHKIHISEQNIDEPSITLSWDNLKYVCRECHAKEHSALKDRRYSIDEFGNVKIHID